MKDDKFHQLVNLYLDREITPEDLQALQAELASNPERLDRFREFVRIRAAEQALFQATDDDAPLRRTRVPFDPVRNESLKKRLFVLNAAAAIAVIVGSLSMAVYSAWPDLAGSPEANVSPEVQEGLQSAASATQAPNDESGLVEEAEARNSVVISLVVSGDERRHSISFPIRREFISETDDKDELVDELSPYAGRIIEISLPEDPEMFELNAGAMVLRQLGSPLGPGDTFGLTSNGTASVPDSP